MKKIKKLCKFDKIPFGKYKGEALCTILLNEPSYLDWAVKNVGGFYVDDEVLFEIEESIKNA